MELERGFGEFEVIESETSTEGEAAVRGGHESARGHRNQGGSGVAGLDFEAMPESGGDLAEFALGNEMKIEEDEWEIAVAQEEVGALEGLFDLGATKPNEVAAFFVPVRSGVESISPINEGERQITFLIKEFGDDEGGSGGVAGRDDFAEMTWGELERNSLRSRFGRSGNRITMSGRKLLVKLAAELINLQDAQNVFIRTLLRFESRRWRSNIKSHGSWLIFGYSSLYD